MALDDLNQIIEKEVLPAWKLLEQAFLEAMQPIIDWWEALPPETKMLVRRLSRHRHQSTDYLIRLKHQRDTIPFIKRGCKL